MSVLGDNLRINLNLADMNYPQIMDLFVSALDINESAKLCDRLTKIYFFNVIHIEILHKSQTDIITIAKRKGTLIGSFGLFSLGFCILFFTGWGLTSLFLIFDILIRKSNGVDAQADDRVKFENRISQSFDLSLDIGLPFIMSLITFSC